MANVEAQTVLQARMGAIAERHIAGAFTRAPCHDFGFGDFDFSWI